MIDNQLAAQILFSNQLATQDQIMACWPEITPEKNIAALLVDQGILPAQTYQDLLSYLESLRNAHADGNGNANGNGAAYATDPPSESPPEADPAREETWTPAQDSPAPEGSDTALVAKVPASLDQEVTWAELMAFIRHHEASDLHLSAGQPALLRRFGTLVPATQTPLSPQRIQAWVESALGKDQMAGFSRTGDLEFVYDMPEWGRYRVTLMKQRSGWDVTARVIPARIRSFEESGLPESCRDLTQWAQGMVLVTGPVGCGKSSTLATLVEMVNQARRDHIITIEDPLEIAYRPAGCRITQRQVGTHTRSREAALRAALREDPDIIVISELRDLDTIQLAVSAAETGHLVFGTMNTSSASRTIHRLIDSFPAEEQPIIRNMVSESLRGVISQQLLPRKDGKGMAAAFEVLLVTSAVGNIIRKDEAHQLHTAMITGKSMGMVLLDDSLRALVEQGLVAPEEAMLRAMQPRDFEKYLGRK